MGRMNFPPFAELPRGLPVYSIRLTIRLSRVAKEPEPEKPSGSRDQRGNKNGQFRGVGRRRVTGKRQIGNEDRHRKTNAAKNSCSGNLAPRQICWQSAETADHGHSTQHNHAHRLAQRQSGDDTDAVQAG